MSDGRTTEFVAVRLPYRVQHDERTRALRFIQPTRSPTLQHCRSRGWLRHRHAAATGEQISDFNKEVM